MNTKSFNEKIEKYKQIIEENQNLLFDTIHEMFGSLSKELFDKNPELHSFGWYQDSIAVDRDIFELNNSEEEFQLEFINDKDWLETIELSEVGFSNIKNLRTAFKAIVNLIDHFNDDDLRILFGYGKVTFKRDNTVFITDLENCR